MKPLSQTAMAEATRLTAAGRLDEAMAMLRGAISGRHRRPPRSEADAGRQPAAPPRTPEFIDMVPPSPATGGCWTSPLHAAADSSSGPESARIFPGLPPADIASRQASNRSAKGRAVRTAGFRQRGGKPRLQALHPIQLHRPAGSAGDDAAWLHAVSR